MRGLTPIEIPVPTGGWRTDVPPHKLAPETLQDGLNIQIDQDGILKPRLGFELLPDQPDFLTDLDPRIVAGIAWQDQLAENLVVAGLRRWFAFVGGAWLNLTPVGQELDSDKSIASRFVQFGLIQPSPPSAVTTQLVGKTAVYGVNGSFHDPLHRWAVGGASFEVVVPAPALGGTPIAPFPAADLAVVADRLVVISTNEGGVAFPRRVRWSSVLDGGMWPQLAYNDLEGPAGNLLAIQTTTRTSAVLYAENGAWLMSAIPGTDAGAFVFDRIQALPAGPLSPNAIINRGGEHVFLGNDLHIWKCDGQSTEIVSQPIDAGLLVNLAVGAKQKPVGLYDAMHQRIIWFLTFQQDDGEALSAIVYDIFHRCWLPPWRFAEAMTSAFPVLEIMGPTWNNPGKDVDGNDFTWNTAPWPTWNDIPENFSPALYGGTKLGKVIRLFSAASDAAQAIAYSAKWGQRAPGDPSERLEVNTLELMLKGRLTAEQLQIQLDTFRTPFDPVPLTVFAQGIDQVDPAAWLVRLDPTMAKAAFRAANYFQFSLSGMTHLQAPGYAGGVLYAFITRRPDVGGSASSA